MSTFSEARPPSLYQCHGFKWSGCWIDCPFKRRNIIKCGGEVVGWSSDPATLVHVDDANAEAPHRSTLYSHRY
jgi:hypothetical protein